MAALSLVFLVVSCSSPARSATVERPPLGLDTPCVYPDYSDLAALANASDVVVRATVATGTFQQAGPAGEWSFALSGVSILSYQGTQTPIVDRVSEVGVAGDPLLKPGPYFLFLLKDNSDVPGQYFVTNGYEGAFAIKGVSAMRVCRNAADPLHPLAASGSPVPTSSMTALLPRHLTAHIAGTNPTPSG